MKKIKKIKKEIKVFVIILVTIIIVLSIIFLTMQVNIKLNEVKIINKSNKENKLNLAQFNINFSNSPKIYTSQTNKVSEGLGIVLKKNSLKINLTASEIEVNLIKGIKTKMYGFNNQFPGPVFIGRVGDWFEINYTNNLNEPSSVHWHGLQLPNAMDGVPAVTQTSVEPGKSFLYNFTLKNPGIYWFHPHYNTADQIERGLYGYIVVKDKKIKIKSDIDSIYSLDDIRLDNNGQISIAGSSPMDTMHGRYGNLVLVNGQASYNINVKKGDLVRLRLLNTANARFFNFAIKNQKILVIGKDIGYVQTPYEVDSLTLAPGERYDILIYFNSSNNKNIVSLGYDQNIKLGELKVNGMNSNSNSNKIYYENLKNKILNKNIPNWTNKINQSANFTMNLKGIGSMMKLEWTINGKVFPTNTEQLNLKEGQFYKIKYKNLQNIAHPMHLHGQKFLVLSRNGVPVKEKGFKDTMIVGANEIVEIGFIATGVGSWVNHCHILEHAEAGMLAVINIK